MKRFVLLTAMVFLFGMTVEATAQGRRDRARIRHGVRSGQLTRDEARELRSERRSLRREWRGYRSDGQLSRSERREIRRDRRSYNRQIRRERRDDEWNNRRYGRSQTRGDGYYRRGAGSPTHPVFGASNRRRGNGRGRW